MEQIKHTKIGLISVIGITISGIIGSGWLFCAYLGAKIAGPAVYVSWVITLLFFLLMGLVISEVVSLFPVRGLVGRMGVISHNRYFGAIFSFAIWLELVGSLPGEAQASVQYLSSLSPSIAHHLMSEGVLTTAGLFLTLLFLVAYWIVNIFGIKFFAKVNNAIVFVKLFVPLLTAVVLIYFAFNFKNFNSSNYSTFMPYGVNSIFTAITVAGMLYVFNGFQLATSFASEIKNPVKIIPLGMILGIIICFVIYILLQTAFIGALNPAELSANGWQALSFNSPFVNLASAIGLNFMALIIYSGAVIAPFGTGITFVGAASRVLYGMSRDQQMPRTFSKLDEKYRFSKSAMLFNFFIALVFLILFHSWAVLILFITALIILMYMVIPVSLIGLRVAMPEMKRGFKLPFAGIICIFLFVVQTFFFVFVGAKNMTYLSVAITIFMIVFITINRPKHSNYHIKDIVVVSLPFLIFLWILNVLIIIGPKIYGGIGILNNSTLFVLVGVLAITSFKYFTSKKFVSKCKMMREHDNAYYVKHVGDEALDQDS